MAVGATMNSYSSFEVQADEDLSAMLGRMEGAKFWSLSMWHYPSSKHFADLNPADYDTWYLQCAGTAERVTVELREPAGDPKDWTDYKHYVLGRGEGSGAPSETISWDGGAHSTQVFGEEVFTAEQAAEIFQAYRETGKVPESFHRRPLDV